MSLFRQLVSTMIVALVVVSPMEHASAVDCSPPLVVVPNPSSPHVSADTRVWFFLPGPVLKPYRMAKGKLNLWRIRKAIRLEHMSKKKRLGGDLRLEGLQEGGAVLSYGPNKPLIQGARYLVTVRLKSDHTVRVAFEVKHKVQPKPVAGKGRYVLDSF